MANQSKLPGIESTVETYLDAWELFEDDRFRVDELWDGLMQQSSDASTVPEQSTLNSRLYRAAAFGLADWFGESRYQLVIGPYAGEPEWETRAVGHLQKVQEHINMALSNRREEESADDDGLVTVNYDGETFVRSDVNPDSEIDKQAKFYLAVLDQNEGHEGVVLRSFPSVADGVRELAEKICDDETMKGVSCPYRFEIVGEEIVPNDGDQEYRVYLKERRFLTS